MGSIKFEGVRFSAFPDDHTPRHVHGRYAEILVIVDLLADGGVKVSDRENPIKPSNGSRADARHVLDVAAKHFNELVALWEKHHGT
jgi:hypothetical protein